MKMEQELLLETIIFSASYDVTTLTHGSKMNDGGLTTDTYRYCIGKRRDTQSPWLPILERRDNLLEAFAAACLHHYQDGSLAYAVLSSACFQSGNRSFVRLRIQQT